MAGAVLGGGWGTSSLEEKEGAPGAMLVPAGSVGLPLPECGELPPGVGPRQGWPAARTLAPVDEAF